MNVVKSMCLSLMLSFPAFAHAETVTGTATYLQRMMLLPGSTLEVTLEDVSRADAPADIIATYRADDPGAPPFAFELEYDPADIDDRMTYAVRATIRREGKLLMTTTQMYPVLTRGAGSQVELLLQQVSQSDTPKVDAELLNTYWKILTIKDDRLRVLEGEREPHMILRIGETPGYSATVGCNQINGGYEVDGTALTLGVGMSTMMACLPPLDAAEAALKSVLPQVARWQIDGQILTLEDENGAPLMTMMAVYLQ
jgi:putative lipoprotein